MGFAGSTGGIAGANDVGLNNPANNDVLTFDSALAKWKNSAAITGPGINKGTYAARAMIANPSVGLCYYQTDNGGGNVTGTITRWSGSQWESLSFNSQIASWGMQSDIWIAPSSSWHESAPSPKQVTSGPTSAFAMYVRPTKTITLQSLGGQVFNSDTRFSYEYAVYLVDGSTTLTKLATTGPTAFKASPAIERTPLLQSVVLEAGSTYAFVIASNDTDNGLYMNGWASYVDGWVILSGYSSGQVPNYVIDSSSYPLPTTLDVSYPHGTPLPYDLLFMGVSYT